MTGRLDCQWREFKSSRRCAQEVASDSLRAAVKSGDLSRKNDCDELAGFLIASLQGVILQPKAERTAVPIERFKHLLFSTLLL
jgi:TetR/AcrR family transcriptional regulator, transcriptional repressor for nem operon